MAKNSCIGRPVTAPSHKASLRGRLRARRRAAAKAGPDAAEAAARICPLETLPALACVGTYHPMGTEMDPGPLVRRLCATGAMVALPAAASRHGPLQYRLWAPGEALLPDAFGAMAPGPSAPEAHPDLVIAPLLGFDRNGRRLGQGGGTYDRTLANLRAFGRVFVLGLAYSGQQVDEVPAEPHDQRLDAVLTETAYLEFGDETA
jgi:5-formyltetrahydrofolate cyclo-ligase